MALRLCLPSSSYSSFNLNELINYFAAEWFFDTLSRFIVVWIDRVKCVRRYAYVTNACVCVCVFALSVIIICIFDKCCLVVGLFEFKQCIHVDDYEYACNWFYLSLSFSFALCLMLCVTVFISVSVQLCLFYSFHWASLLCSSSMY